MRYGVRLGVWYRLGLALLWPWARLFTRPDWRGAWQLPESGGVIVAANHISLADPFVLLEFLVYGARRPPRYLAKSQLFHGPGLVAHIMRGARQIPVDRGTPDAASALKPALRALRAGECIAIYPEGTVTLDPEGWPMPARTGVARLALSSGVPVVPVAQWGAQDIFDPHRRLGLRLRLRQPVMVQAGPPVDLSKYQGRELTAEVLSAATATVQAAVTAELEQLRGRRRPTKSGSRPDPASAAKVPGSS